MEKSLFIFSNNYFTLTEQYIPETDVAFAVNALVEAMPQTLFLKLEEKLGRPADHPKMMLKIILYAYTQCIFSGRKIEFLLDDSYRMRWLANHGQVSYRTINRFRSQETTAHLLAESFVLFRRQLITNQAIDNEALFIDGTKIEADTGYESEENYTYINDILHKTPLSFMLVTIKKIKRPIETVLLWLITGAIWKKKIDIFALPIGQFPSSDIVEEKIKADLYVTSKFMNVKIVKIVLFVVNVRKQKVSKTDKF